MDMSIQDWGSIGEMVGAGGVVVSLVYLALQIRQSNRAARSSKYQEVYRDQRAVTRLSRR